MRAALPKNRERLFLAFVTAGFLVIGALTLTDWSDDRALQQIHSNFRAIQPGMALDDVHRLLGPPGDHRRDPNKAAALARPLAPFIKPVRQQDKVDLIATRISHYGMYRCEYWQWDNGSIGVHYSEGDPHRVLRTDFEPDVGPRNPLARSADPIRNAVYSVVDWEQYTAIWRFLCFFVMLVGLLLVAIWISFRIRCRRAPRRNNSVEPE